MIVRSPSGDSRGWDSDPFNLDLDPVKINLDPVKINPDPVKINPDPVTINPVPQPRRLKGWFPCSREHTHKENVKNGSKSGPNNGAPLFFFTKIHNS